MEVSYKQWGVMGKDELDLSDFQIKKDKTFPLRIPQKLHDLAKKKAKDERLPLHDWILKAMIQALKE